MTPTQFSTDTFVDDFADDGREIWARTERTAVTWHRARIGLVNGWAFSVVWGFGSYATGARDEHTGFIEHPPKKSPDAEVMPFPPGDGRLDLNGDTVAGWILPAQLLAAVEAAERNDEAGVVEALTAKEDE